MKNGTEHEVNGEMIGCNNNAIGNDVLECAVLQALNDISFDKEPIISKITKMINKIIRKQEQEQFDFRKAEQEIKKIQAKKIKNIDTFYDNGITQEYFKSLK